MKRASYREAVAWIALNDSDGSADALYPQVVSELVTALLVADLFGVEAERVGRDIVRYRKKAHEEERKASNRPKDKCCTKCKMPSWTCRGCGRRLCEHYCSRKSPNRTAICSKCERNTPWKPSAASPRAILAESTACSACNTPTELAKLTPVLRDGKGIAVCEGCLTPEERD